ncbi:MAG: uroporphyrinogen-III C-methyltransferase [Pseudomonadota bacterium]|nr:uroporphyrinogen-III C-methyltransferase [Pseudomonadota bacterium]MEC8200646.1 uroporphyrinogen-III C-methyltransferase [Pseudomonadota bacterium]MEC8369768.1 uroporphyrinogen-III C-methyltransferase [Pseudomonadota bacterium]
MFRRIPNLPDFEPGWVWLTGAGPGDPGLMTVLALHALYAADTVIYDALVSKEILALANENAELIYAGKRGGKPSPKQHDISHKLIGLAREGRRVLRLKGGDPFIFGRGGEEALALVAAGVDFRVIPGVSAGVGGLAYAGIPLTHRDTNSAVTFVTGHNASGIVPDSVDWQSVAKGSDALVVYMPLKHITQISKMLINAGRSSDEPAAVVSKATMAEQQTVVSTLANIATDAASAALSPPAMLIVGDVVRLREGLDWLSALGGSKLNPDPLGNRQLDHSA